MGINVRVKVVPYPTTILFNIEGIDIIGNHKTGSIAIFNTLFWSFLGYILYKSMYNYARKSGKLGRY